MGKPMAESTPDPRNGPNAQRQRWTTSDKLSPRQLISSNLNTPPDLYGQPQLSSKNITALGIQPLPQVHLTQGTVGQSIANVKLR
jgi:hypothetical protein